MIKRIGYGVRSVGRFFGAKPQVVRDRALRPASRVGLRWATGLPAASSNPKQPLAHDYSRRINFLNATGFAIRSVQLFTREARWRGDTAEHSLHVPVLRQHGFREGPAPASQLDVFASLGGAGANGVDAATLGARA